MLETYLPVHYYIYIYIIKEVGQVLVISEFRILDFCNSNFLEKNSKNRFFFLSIFIYIIKEDELQKS